LGIKDTFDVDQIDNFSAEQIARARAEPEKYSAALVFSTKYDPPPMLSLPGLRSEAMEERFFGLHHDLTPETIGERIGRNAGVETRRPGDVDLRLIRFDRGWWRDRMQMWR